MGRACPRALITVTWSSREIARKSGAFCNRMREPRCHSECADSVFSAMPARPALFIIGNSDAIGLHSTRRLLESRLGRITGISRRASPVAHAGYRHHVLTSAIATTVEKLRAIVRQGLVDPASTARASAARSIRGICAATFTSSR